VRWPCFYGIDFATRAELIATGLGPEEIRASIGADSLGYISEEGMISATNQPADQLCAACFTGRYPIDQPEDGHVGKHVLETLPLTVRTGHDRSVDVDGVTLGVGAGGAGALNHP
jgi:amidophosphoribosyltransferase